MKKTKLFLLLVLSIVISCKDDKKTEQSSGGFEGKNGPQNFHVEIDAASGKKDDFAIYYTEDETTNFTDKSTVWRDIKGGKPSEKILFDLPEEVVPTNIRLDFSLNKDQEFVEIQKIKIAFYENNFEFKGADFFTFFNKDDNFATEIDQAKGTLRIVRKNNEFKTPFFYPKQVLVDKIKAMTTNK